MDCKELADPFCCASEIELFQLGHELERPTTALTAAEAAPNVAVEIDHKLPVIMPVVNRATADQSMIFSLEFVVELVVRHHEGQGH